MSKIEKVVAMYDKYVMCTYKRVPFCLEKAKGSKVWDIDGRVYLDFFPAFPQNPKMENESLPYFRKV